MTYKFNNAQLQPKGASIVYWAHLPDHDDMWSQGYIGITKQPASARWRDHLSHAKIEADLPFARALNKYPNIVFDVIVVGQTRKYCETIEAQLRPALNIGWNINAGGDEVNTMAGGLANKARLEKLKLTDPHWIAKQAAKDKAAAQAQARRDAAAQKRIERQQYMAQGIGQLNRKLDSRNTSGYTGVHLHKCGKYQAQYRGKSLGYFETPEKAHECYVLAKRTHLLQNE